MRRHETALKLTAEQNPLWEAFENAVRGGAKSRMDDMRQMLENRDRMSPSSVWMTAGHMARPPMNLKDPKRPNRFTASRRYAEAQVRLQRRDDDGGEWANVGGVGDAGAPGCQGIGTTGCKLVTPSDATMLVTSMTPMQSSRLSAVPDLPVRYPTRRPDRGVPRLRADTFDRRQGVPAVTSSAGGRLGLDQLAVVLRRLLPAMLTSVFPSSRNRSISTASACGCHLRRFATERQRSRRRVGGYAQFGSAGRRRDPAPAAGPMAVANGEHARRVAPSRIIAA